MRLVLFLAVMLSATPALAQTASDPGNMEAGEKLAREVCIECHIVANGQTEPGRIDAPTFFEVADAPATTGFQLRAFLRSPHYAMPNLILSAEETDDIIAYILSLKGQ